MTNTYGMNRELKKPMMKRYKNSRLVDTNLHDLSSTEKVVGRLFFVYIIQHRLQKLSALNALSELVCIAVKYNNLTVSV